MMFLILSSKFCESELIAEYGKLPPTLLPVGNKRLYELQVAQIQNEIPEAEIFISFPQDFILSEFDQKKLAQLKVKAIYISPELNIGEAIYKTLKQINTFKELRILYGDTYIANIDIKINDLCFISKVEDEYRWHFIDNQEALCGYFSFSDGVRFLKILTDNNYCFFEALNNYKKEIGLINVSTVNWYDFGHIHTYYKSKTLITTARSFNVLEFNDFIVTKKSINLKKCEAEAIWYESAPLSIKVHTPNFLGIQYNEEGKFSGYNIEYLYLSAVSELFVFAELESLSWKQIYKNIFLFLNKMYRIKSNNNFNDKSFYLNKTLKRLSEFSIATGFDIEKKLFINDEETPSLTEIARNTYDALLPVKTDYICFSHGDLCFSNILYDFRSNNIKVIDPRGLDGDDNFSSYGDIRYDIAKLAHSAIGKYDLIIAGMFSASMIKNRIYIEFSKNHKDFIEDLFWQNIEQFIPNLKSDIYSIMIHLFLSMLPLHSDCQERQLGLLANGLRLYKDFKKLKLS